MWIKKHFAECVVYQINSIGNKNMCDVIKT